MNSGIQNKFQLQNPTNRPNEYNFKDQSFTPEYEKLFKNTTQLANLLISMDITSIENINLKSNKINENIPEINRLLNIIIQNLISLGIQPTVAIGSRPTTYDIYNILSFASLLLYNNRNIEPKIQPVNPKPATINTEKKDLKDDSELDNVNKTRIFVLESEIQSIQVKYQGLNEECQKRRSKIRSLQTENNDLHNKNESLEKDILKLKLKIEQLQIENESLVVNQNLSKLNSENVQINKENTKEHEQNRNDPNFDYKALKAELNIKIKENQKLNRALIEISREMAKNSLNLENELIQKNKFITIIQQQLIALDEYERMYQKHQTKVNKLEATLQATQSTIQHLESKQKENELNHNLNSDTIESLKIYFSAKSDFHNKTSNNNFNIISNILNILQNTKKDQNENEKDTFVYSKIIEIFDFLFQQLKNLNDKVNSYHLSTEVADLAEMERIKKVNERFSQYIMSMIQFFEHLANSAEMQGWMIDLPCNENLRPLLLSQCNKVENFVKKNQQVKDFYEVKNESEIKKFLTENNKSANKNNDDLLSLPSLVEKLFSDVDDQHKVKNSELIQSLFTKENEFLIILHLCASANDALRRCAEHTIDSNRLLSDEIKVLRREMQLANKDAEVRVHEMKESYESKIQEEQESLKNAENLLHSIQDELRRSEEIDSDKKSSSYEHFVNKKIVKRCLALLNGDEIESSELDDNNYYYSYLSEYSNNENKVSKKSEKVENIDELKNEIESLKKQIKLYEKRQDSSDSIENRNKLLENEKKKISAELKNANQQLKELNKKIEKIDNENTLLKTEIKSLKHNEKNLMKESSTLVELTEEIESLRQRNEELSSSFVKEKKVTKKAIKNRIKLLKDEIENQQKQNEELKNNFDLLLSDLRNKLKEATEINAKSINREKELSLLNKQLSSELSTTKVDLKMLQMRITTIEEKNQRDKKLVETQCKMKILNFQTKCQSEIEKVKSKFECKIHNFQISVVQHFKEFMNFRNTINEESVFEVLDQVTSELKRLNHLCSIYELINKDMTAIKAVVGGFDETEEINDDIESNNQLLIKITDLVQTKNRYLQLESDYQNLHKKIESNQTTNESIDNFNENFDSVSAYEWEQWARKVAALSSDNFLQLRSARELQFSIEETLLGSINQRKVTKRLEILRIEKKILASGLLNTEIDTNKVFNINTLIILITAVRKMQKVSGHLPCNIPQPIRALEMMKKKNANKKNL